MTPKHRLDFLNPPHPQVCLWFEIHKQVLACDITIGHLSVVRCLRLTGLLVSPILLSAFLLSTVIFFYYVSSADENIDFCVVGPGLHRVSAVRQEDVGWEIRPKSARSFSFYEHAERERGA